MKKFAIMAVVALIAGPAMGTDADVDVEINVVQYCAITTLPAILDMTVDDIQETSGGSPVVAEGWHQATTTFVVQGNAGFAVMVHPQYVSNSVIWTYGAPGSGSGDQYPTAYIGGAPETPPTNGIGFGLAIRNVTDATPFVAYNPNTTSATAGFSAGMGTGELKINTYLDSGRSGNPAAGGGELANVGSYTTLLYLTLIP